MSAGHSFSRVRPRPFLRFPGPTVHCQPPPQATEH